MRKSALLLLCLTVTSLGAAEFATLVRDAEAAEARFDSRRALELFLQAAEAQPNNATVSQKIARQYSDLVLDQPTTELKRQYAQKALDYAQRAVALQPDNAVNELSVGISYGKLALYSDTRDKVAYSRAVKVSAERALALDPQYAWAHHVLGRWHYEVAELGATARFFVRLIYGSLPPADPAEAVRQLQRATELEPTELNHFLELGFAHAALGQFAEARRAWEHGLAMPTRAKHDDGAKQRAREALARLKQD